MVALRIARVSLVRVTSNETTWPATGRSGAAPMEMAVGASTATRVVPLTSPTDAVTSAAAVVVRAVRASPDGSVVATRARRAPAVAEKVTRTFGSRFCDASSTVATTAAVPPAGGRLPGRAVTSTDATAAAPMVTSTGSLTASPEYARTSAVPDRGPAVNVALARPRSVGASAGPRRPGSSRR